MIKIKTPCFIATSEDTQTSTKVGSLTVNYNCFLGTKQVAEKTVPQGYIQSFVCNETMNSIMGDVQEDTIFNDNILNELTEQYIAKLSLLNPNVTFTSTL